jgi:hypothetical protein
VRQQAELEERFQETWTGGDSLEEIRASTQALQEEIAKIDLEGEAEQSFNEAVRRELYRNGKTVYWGGDGPITMSFAWAPELKLGTLSTSYKEGDAFSGPLQQAIVQFKTDATGAPILLPSDDGGVAPVITFANVALQNPTGRWLTEQIVAFGSSLGANFFSSLTASLLSEGCEGCNDGVIVGSVGAFAEQYTKTTLDGQVQAYLANGGGRCRGEEQCGGVAMR